MNSHTALVKPSLALWPACFDAVTLCLIENHSEVRDVVRSLSKHLSVRLAQAHLRTDVDLDAICRRAVQEAVVQDHSDAKATAVALSQTLANILIADGRLRRASQTRAA